MSISINNNLMASRAAGSLSGHYARLYSSVERLSSGLRINSAADDAAGLAIRELMRADVAAMNQGVRNANDAISMLQVADGALAVIDEKLIRMKELAEQAATGTYDSTQRLMIESEYQAMADEIDRIARSTSFNGIHLLNGSLSGRHDGSGLNATGSMKIHFGSGNDSAEDYYYVSIGDCTAGALGLGDSSTNMEPEVTYVLKEVVTEVNAGYKPKTKYDVYTDPDTGKSYYRDGDNYFTDLDNPFGTRLDLISDAELIKRLKLQQETQITQLRYKTYLDPLDNKEYYSRDNGKTFTPDIYDPIGVLDSNNAAENQIINRLQSSTKEVQVNLVWKVYEDPASVKFYSYDNGRTFVPDPWLPVDNVLDTRNPAHVAQINTFKPVMDSKEVKLPTITINYKEYYDQTTSQLYFSSDGGKTFVVDTWDPDGTRLDPIRDAAIIANLAPVINDRTLAIFYDKYRDPADNKEYYTKDYGKTFIDDVTTPDNIIFSKDNPAHAADIDRLEPIFSHRDGLTSCDVYEDVTNPGKRYYTMNQGQSFFDDVADPAGSTLNASNPADAAVLGNLQKIGSTVDLIIVYDTYIRPTTSIRYYSCDGGKTFVRDPNDAQNSALDPVKHKDIIDSLVPDCQQKWVSDYYYQFKDPVDGKFYYTLKKGDGSIFVDGQMNVLLDASIPSQKLIIDRLEGVQHEVQTRIEQSFPEYYYVYENKLTGFLYYSPDEGKTFTSKPTEPYQERYQLDPSKASDKRIIDNLQPYKTQGIKMEYVRQETGGTDHGAGYTISTQEAAQKALEAVDRAIVSKDKIRASLGALQNRLENTITTLTIQGENLETAESRISDADIAIEMMRFCAQPGVEPVGHCHAGPGQQLSAYSRQTAQWLRELNSKKMFSLPFF